MFQVAGVYIPSWAVFAATAVMALIGARMLGLFLGKRYVAPVLKSAYANATRSGSLFSEAISGPNRVAVPIALGLIAI